jgi:hypothetical protein
MNTDFLAARPSLDFPLFDQPKIKSGQASSEQIKPNQTKSNQKPLPGPEPRQAPFLRFPAMRSNQNPA